ncbi:hypothetical protein S245_003834, partial [Arachis hypogaea]
LLLCFTPFSRHHHSPSPFSFVFTFAHPHSPSLFSFVFSPSLTTHRAAPHLHLRSPLTIAAPHLRRSPLTETLKFFSLSKKNPSRCSLFQAVSPPLNLVQPPSPLLLLQRHRNLSLLLRCVASVPLPLFVPVPSPVLHCSLSLILLFKLFCQLENSFSNLTASARVYRLSWIPFTRAFDSHIPFVFQFNGNLSHNQQQQLEMIKEVSFSTEEVQSVDLIIDSYNSPLVEQNEERNQHFKDETFEVQNDPMETETSHFSVKFDSDNEPFEHRNQVLLPPFMQSVDEVCSIEKTEACPEAELLKETNLLCTLREYLTESLCLPVVEALQGTTMQQFQTPQNFRVRMQFSPLKSSAANLPRLLLQEKFLQERIKVGGKAGALGDFVTVSREKNKRGLRIQNEVCALHFSRNQLRSMGEAKNLLQYMFNSVADVRCSI